MKFRREEGHPDHIETKVIDLLPRTLILYVFRLLSDYIRPIKRIFEIDHTFSGSR